VPARVSGTRTWWALTALLMAAGLAGLALDPHAIDWQPQRWASQAWRWWTPVAVHYGALHWAANLAGALALAWLASRAAITRPMAWAWCAAWPLTHLGLLLRPSLQHYGGASGVLHAGVAVVGLHLLNATGPRRSVGAAVLAGLALKLVLERPWGPVVQPGWGGLAVAPFSHASGAAAGMACALFALALTRRRAA
jgi:rhomboid family GlyGly-CTERM serine protease